MNTLPQKHVLPDKCPFCGDVVRNDMAVVTDTRTRVRTSGHVQFSCNYEVDIQPGKEPELLHECRKGKIWPTRT
jgi:hypothetical protein